MHYQFPVINHINDVLPAIVDAPEFAVTEKDGYTVINYHVMTAESFPAVTGDDTRAAIRRECRGIIFDNASGKIIRRPYHKFFNVNEREETQEHLINISQPHAILEKLDGSMISAFLVNDRVIWGTKMGDTDVSKTTNEFLSANPQYEKFARYYINLGFTPIFEWCSLKQRIVIDYSEDRLVLTAMRDMITGEYKSYDSLELLCKIDNIPLVKRFDSQTDINEFVKYVSLLENTEGFVIRFDDGHMLKLKCDWYLQIHKAKERITRDREIVDMILAEQIDDVAAHLLPEEANRIRAFEELFFQHLNFHVQHVINMLTFMKENNVTRKNFSLSYTKHLDSFKKTLCFCVFDDYRAHNVRERAIEIVKKNTVNNIKWNELRDLWFKGLKYNA